MGAYNSFNTFKRNILKKLLGKINSCNMLITWFKTKKLDKKKRGTNNIVPPVVLIAHSAEILFQRPTVGNSVLFSLKSLTNL